MGTRNKRAEGGGGGGGTKAPLVVGTEGKGGVVVPRYHPTQTSPPQPAPNTHSPQLTDRH